jgi:hypothetical protein
MHVRLGLTSRNLSVLNGMKARNCQVNGKQNRIYNGHLYMINRAPILVDGSETDELCNLQECPK